MASGGWSTSTRRERLPANWQALRRLTRDRAGGQCEALVRGTRCPNPGTDCDHIVPGDDHHPGNLAWLCGPCHRAKSAQEGVQARAAKPGRQRPAERHPGLLGPPGG